MPTLDRRNGRADRLRESVAKHTSHLDYEFVLHDCQGELLGYTKPMNLAAAQAEGEFIAALNDDIEVSPRWADQLLAAFDDGDQVWCVTPDATHTDGPQIFAPYCMFWRRSAWRQIGGLDEQFVLWGSDIDLAKRLLFWGHPPVRVKLDIPIKHELNATSVEHPELGEVCMADLQRFAAKWGQPAEEAKRRMVQEFV